MPLQIKAMCKCISFAIKGIIFSFQTCFQYRIDQTDFKRDKSFLFFFQIIIKQRQLNKMRRNSSFRNKTMIVPPKVIIDEKYMFKGLTKMYSLYGLYQGVDIIAKKNVNIYIKPNDSQFNFSKKIKEELRNNVSPQVVWRGLQKIQHKAYMVQVHQKYGPSLKAMFSVIKDQISQKDFLLLLYQMIKLIERYLSLGYVYRGLNLQKIIFDQKPLKNELYLINVFQLVKKNEQCKPLNSKFCSRGAHLGLNANIKDDLESICYILMDIYTQGHFLSDTDPADYLQEKTHINFTDFKCSFPSLFIDFYNYVIGLNYQDDPNLFKWKNLLFKQIGKETILNPYRWMKAKNNSTTISEQEGESGQQSVDGEIEDELSPEDRYRLHKLSRSQKMDCVHH